MNPTTHSYDNTPNLDQICLQISPNIEVVRHLVRMAKDVASLCTISYAEFFEDLTAIYAFLNDPSRVAIASNIIREYYEDETI